MRKYLEFLKGDKVIWVLVSLLLMTSLLTVFSFVPILVRTQGGSPYGYFFKHGIYVVIGFALMYWIHLKDPKYIEKLSKFILIVGGVLLLFTFFFGVSVNDATRWVRIPLIGLTFQSSDFAKLALVIYVAHVMVSKKDKMNSWKEGFIYLIGPVAIICGLIAKDNFSTAALLFLVILGMFFIGKVPFGKIIASLSIGAGLMGVVVLIHYALPSLNFLPRLDTWVNRFFRAYGDEGITNLDNMQAINAKLAIHNGGYFGVGVGEGDLKLYTPEAYADFYYSSFIEELGLVFGIVIILLYLILFYRILRIGLNAERLFETYMAIGIGLVFMSQTLTNMFVCTGLMPVTGQNIPFLGMGGSGMVMSCVALGIVLSIARKNEEVKHKK